MSEVKTTRENQKEVHIEPAALLALESKNMNRVYEDENGTFSFAAFIDNRYIGEITRFDQPRMLQAICTLQFNQGSDTNRTFTVLDRAEGLAFSQEYQKRPGGLCSHSAMWKHERGVTGPLGPSFDELEETMRRSIEDFLNHDKVFVK